jgi:hypothetical protein
LRRARRTSKPPESSTIAETAEAPSISGATVTPANAKPAAPTSNKLKPINFDTILSSELSRSFLIASRVYLLRRARRTNKPPESRTIADTAEAPSISGATTSSAKAELAAPASNKLKPRILYMILSSGRVYFLRRARRTSKLPESRATADTAEAPSISGAATGPANAQLAAPINKRLKPINFDMNISAD